MDDGSKPPLLSLFFLFCFSAYLSCVETALASVSKNKIKVAAEHGDSRAKVALKIIEKFDRAITTILIFNNICNLSIASIVTVWVTKMWGLSFVSVATVITTVAVFFACEMLPKSLGKKNSFKIMLSGSSLLSVLMFIAKPFASFLSGFGSFVQKHSQSDTEVSVTEDELQDIIEDMAEEGTLDEQQSELISSALQFGDVTAEKILTPRREIKAIDVDESPDAILEFIRQQTHSRIPVYKDSIDNIVGVIQTRKYMKEYMHCGHAPETAKVTDRVYYTHRNTEIHELLPLMSKHKVNMVVVTDDFEGTLGIITIEDILEELVGDIWDESDDIAAEQNMRTAGNTASVYLEDEKE